MPPCFVRRTAPGSGCRCAVPLERSGLGLATPLPGRAAPFRCASRFWQDLAWPPSFATAFTVSVSRSFVLGPSSVATAGPQNGYAPGPTARGLTAHVYAPWSEARIVRAQARRLGAGGTGFAAEALEVVLGDRPAARVALLPEFSQETMALVRPAVVRSSGKERNRTTQFETRRDTQAQPTSKLHARAGCPAPSAMQESHAGWFRTKSRAISSRELQRIGNRCRLRTGMWA